MIDAAVARQAEILARAGSFLDFINRGIDYELRYYPLIKPLARGATEEISGLYWEDFHPGDVFEHRPGRTVLDADNVWFTCSSQCAAGAFRCGLRQQNGMEKVTG